jgi:hypothetical protein
MPGQYALVAFDEGEQRSVAIVPANWLDGDDTFWAPYNSQGAFDKAVMMAEKPASSWKKYSCRILGIKGKNCNFFT